MTTNFKISLPADLLQKLRADSDAILKRHLFYSDNPQHVPAYPVFVERLMKGMPTLAEELHHSGSGMAGEAGEISDLTKKCWIYGAPLDAMKMIKELGDLRFYYQAMLNALCITDEEVQVQNMIKLMERFPNGYSDAAAIARADVKPASPAPASPNPATEGLSAAGHRGTGAPAPRRFMGQRPQSAAPYQSGDTVYLSVPRAFGAIAKIIHVGTAGGLTVELLESCGVYKDKDRLGVHQFEVGHA